MNKHFKFMMYLAIIILLNIAGTNQFFRADMTANKIYSLSKASRDAVASLSDPLTIKVFFTAKLPAPYNNIERYLHDLLEEYSLAGNNYFNYQFLNVSSEKEEDAGKSKEMASSYGIHPVQVRNIEQDEVKFLKAYMGMAMIHGDVIETIPTITTTEGLEYNITNKIRKMNNKISALLNLEEKVEILLYLSSSLQAVGPYMNLTDLPGLPGKIEEIVKKINSKHYEKLKFRYLDPSQNPEYKKQAEENKLVQLRWNDFKDRRGEMIPAANGFAGMIVRHGEKQEQVRFLNVIKIPIFGTQYQLMNMDTLETALSEAVENVIDINEEIGFLASHDCLKIGGFSMPGQPPKGDLANFNKLIGENYSIKQVDLKKESIPDGLASLIIAGPKETFSDYELHQIDQYLMKGKNIIFFMDSFNEIMPQNRNQMRYQQNQQPSYVPIRTGIEKLLAHYGLSSKLSYVMDENCFKQRLPQNYGGGEMPIYFAPVIKGDWINDTSSIMKNIKGLAVLKASPVDLNEKKIKDNSLKAFRLFSSTDRSWEMKGRIDLNPMYMQPPQTEDQRKSMALAYVLEGSFPSYYADKPMPEKIVDDSADKEEEKQESREEAGIDTSSITSTGITIKKGTPGKIFLIGTSEILRDNVIDEKGNSPNANFVMNVIDYFNGREAYALMRTKAQRFNPLEKINPQRKMVIKSFNIAGLPVIIIIAGLIVWFRRTSRRRMIQNMFRQ